jgi:hypothetical protein
VIKDQVNQSERANDSPGEKRFASNVSPDQPGIGGRDYGQCADPEMAMVAAEFVPERARLAGLK